MGSTGAVVSRAVGRFGTRPFLTAGPAIVGTGLTPLSRLGVHSTYVVAAVSLVAVRDVPRGARRPAGWRRGLSRSVSGDTKA